MAGRWNEHVDLYVISVYSEFLQIHAVGNQIDSDENDITWPPLLNDGWERYKKEYNLHCFSGAFSPQYSHLYKFKYQISYLHVNGLLPGIQFVLSQGRLLPLLRQPVLQGLHLLSFLPAIAARLLLFSYFFARRRVEWKRSTTGRLETQIRHFRVLVPRRKLWIERDKDKEEKGTFTISWYIFLAVGANF